jgi:hypothetical protein
MRSSNTSLKTTRGGDNLPREEERLKAGVEGGSNDGDIDFSLKSGSEIKVAVQGACVRRPSPTRHPQWKCLPSNHPDATRWWCCS